LPDTSRMSAAVFLLALAIVSLTSAPQPGFSQPPQRVTPPVLRQASADDRVKEYVQRFFILDSIFEAHDPGWPERVRREGTKLADLLGRENPSELRTARKILQPEYRGWALLMVARSFVEKELPQEERKRQRIEFATRAIQEFDKAIDVMANVVYRTKQYSDDKDAIEVYNWMMGMTDPPSDDFKRIHYLKAISIAVIARAGGNRSKQDVRDELKIIPDYLIDHPNNPDLNWALADSTVTFFDLFPDDWWRWLRDHLWWDLLMAVPAGAIWILARYRRLSAFWRWAAFAMLEVLLGIAGVAAASRYGAPAATPAVVVLLALALLVYRLDKRT
jgi:hypothetical protein